ARRRAAPRRPPRRSARRGARARTPSRCDHRVRVHAAARERPRRDRNPSRVDVHDRVLRARRRPLRPAPTARGGDHLMASVTFDHVTKTYAGGTHAVDDLQLQITDGEFLVLVGPSGCGKSTALRMVAGLEQISGGRILIGERVVNNVAPMSRDVAMVFQSYALYPHMTVYDNLAFGLRNKKVPKDEIERRVQEAGKILDLENMLQRKPKQLSGGQRQRVALGRAIVREPAVWLMDEPLSNLDAALRVATRAEILKLHQRVGT